MLCDQFNFIFHDATTFAPYEAEVRVVVHELLGRKGRRVGGKDGVGFVLKSLPENARNLYRVLLSEILTVLADDLDQEVPGQDTHAVEDERAGSGQKRAEASESSVGIEYRVLYQKASEEFICQSEMSFRTLMKEFHDHQMIESRKDASGTEVLGVPLSREEMEGVLEDLVLE